MEHSKLYQSGSDVMTDNSRFIARCRTKEQAAFIVTACNEHDTLKAEEELLGEMVEYIEWLKSDVIDNLNSPWWIGCADKGGINEDRLETLLSKAKALD